MSDQFELPLPPGQRPMKISSIAQIAGSRRQSNNVPSFELPTYMPGVLPGKNQTRLAMDNSTLPGFQVNNMYAYAQASTMFEEGLGFMGYPYLAQLSQRTEYRRPVEIIAEEMTRKWIKFEASGDKDKGNKIKQIEDEFRRFNVRQVIRHALELDGYMGIGPIYIDVGTYNDDEEQKIPLVRKKQKIAKGSLKGFTPIDPLWMAPNDYNSSNPLDPEFFKPQNWFVMAKLIHRSRFMMVVSRPVPDVLKPAYNFGGIALTQLMKPYIDNWLRTRQSVSDLIQAFTVFVLETNMMGILAGGNGETESNRVRIFEYVKNNLGLMVVDKEHEALSNVSAPLGTLDHLQAQSQEHMSNPPGIPLVKLFGITPSGLNASTDGEIRVFYDGIHAKQEFVLEPVISEILDIIQLNCFGDIDEDIHFSFNSLFELDDAGAAAVEKTKADTDSVYLEQGIIEPEDVRKRVALTKQSMYPGLDLSAPVPGPPEDLMTQGLGAGGGQSTPKTTNAKASGTKSEV